MAGEGRCSGALRTAASSSKSLATGLCARTACRGVTVSPVAVAGDSGGRVTMAECGAGARDSLSGIEYASREIQAVERRISSWTFCLQASATGSPHAFMSSSCSHLQR